MRRFRVDTIRINDVQKRWPGYKALRTEIVKIQEERLKQTEAEIKKQIAEKRAEWEAANEPPDRHHAERWEKHAADERKTNGGGAQVKRANPYSLKRRKADVVNVDVKTEKPAHLMSSKRKTLSK